MSRLSFAGRDQQNEEAGVIPALVFAVAWISRWPFLRPGFGDDADAWRVAEAARQMSATGVFHSSRVPGHPVSDALMGWLYPLGPVFITGMTALLGAVAVVCFYQWLRIVKARQPLICAAALAFMPTFYVSSTTALDFVWAFAFLMASLLAVMYKRALTAGILLGLAIGCRNTSGAFLAPLAILLYTRPGLNRPLRTTVLLASVSVGVGALTYLPVYLKEGLPYLLHYWEDPYPAWPIRLVFSLYELTGLIGGVTIAAILIVRLSCKTKVERRPAEQPAVVMAASTGILLYTIAFLVLPHEGIYLLPAIPFILFMADRYLLSPRAMQVLAGALLLSSMLLSIEPVKHPDGPGEAPARNFRLFGFLLELHWLGPVPSEKVTRQEGIAYADRILEALTRESAPAALVAGRWQPILLNRLAEQHPEDIKDNIAILYLLDRHNLENYRHRGYRLFMLPFQNERNAAMYGVDLIEENVKLLPFVKNMPSDSAPQR